MNIAGRFTIADITPNALIIGLVGAATIDGLTPANIDHIRAFYNMPRAPFELLNAYPVRLNLTHYTGFIVLHRRGVIPF